jgi:hypothetical protein
MEMENELFVLNLKDPKLTGLVSGNGGTADGPSSQFSGALKLGLKQAVKIKRRSKGVLLQCPRGQSTRHTNPVSHSFVGSNLVCPNCSDFRANYYMQCSGCRYARMGTYESCKNCGRRFI